jgi:CRISPR-associated protein Cas8a1/Csx13
MAEEERTLVWSLTDDGMGILERAGLAALYMTLRTADEQSVDLEPLDWAEGDLTAHSVTVRWTGEDHGAFERLFAWAWQIRDGVFYFPAIHRELGQKEFAYRRVFTHNGVLGTFLQHNRVQPRAKGKDATTLVEQIEEGKQIRLRFPEIDPRRHGIKPLKDLKLLFQNGRFSDAQIPLSGWVLPGIAPRYATERAWMGSASRAILLMLSPIACCYQRLAGKGNNWIFVAPDVRDLEQFNDLRPYILLSPDAVDVASLGDAGLRFAAAYAARGASREVHASSRVVAMGRVGYYPSQSVRKAVLDVKPTQCAVNRYRHLIRTFPNSYILIKAEPTTKSNTDEDPLLNEQEGSGFFSVPSGRGRIADNLVAGRSWYKDLFIPLEWDSDRLEWQRKAMPGRSIERIWFHSLSYQRRRLMELIQETEMWDDELERRFVEAFWSTLASLYAKEAKAVERGGSRSFEERLDDLNEDIRRSLMRAKTRVLLRGFLAELFAKGSRQPAVVQNRAGIWNLMDHPYDWKKARDLALLALATYQSKDKRERSTTKNTEEEGETR